MSTLKIPRDKFLARLVERKKEYELAVAKQAKLETEYNKAKEEFIKKVIKDIQKDPSLLKETFLRYDGGIDIHVKPNQNHPRMEHIDMPLSKWDYDELCNIINLVEMSEADVIPATFQKNAMRFL